MPIEVYRGGGVRLPLLSLRRALWKWHWQSWHRSRHFFCTTRPSHPELEQIHSKGSFHPSILLLNECKVPYCPSASKRKTVQFHRRQQVAMIDVASAEYMLNGKSGYFYGLDTFDRCSDILTYGFTLTKHIYGRKWAMRTLRWPWGWR